MILTSQLLLDILSSNDLVPQPSQLLSPMVFVMALTLSSPLIVAIDSPYLRCLSQPQQFFDATQTSSPSLLPSFHCPLPAHKLAPHLLRSELHH